MLQAIPDSAARGRLTGIDLGRLFRPRGIAIVGASVEPQRIGGQPLRSLTEFGYAGAIYPVNPKYKEIRGLPCYGDVGDVPQPCDVALVAAPTKAVPDVIRNCGRAGIAFAVVLSAGFGELGERGREMHMQLDAAIRESGVRVIGPNCVGVLNVHDKVFCGFGATFRNVDRPFGSVAIVSQSGGFGTSIIGLAEAAGLGFHYSASTGNEADITTVDVLEWYVEQADVDVVVSYIEGIADGPRFVAVGKRALEVGKPILIWKVGNSETGRRAAESHTATMTGRYELYREAFRCGGFVEVEDVGELVDASRAFQSGRRPRSKHVAVVTVSGGAGVLLADQCIARGLELPSLSEDTRTKLEGIVPDFGSLRNPIDLTAQGHNVETDFFSETLRVVLADPDIGQVIARGLGVQAEAAEKYAAGLAALAAHTDKPLVIAGGIPEGRGGAAEEILRKGGIPYYATPTRAAKAVAALSNFAAKQRLRPASPSARTAPRRELGWPAKSRTLSEHETKQHLRSYGVPIERDILLGIGDVDALNSLDVPFPVSVKIDSADIPHKTEAGAVRLGVHDLTELKAAAKGVFASALRFCPTATINGILIQPMASGLECIVGATNDETFGPTVMFGLGGVTAELLKDVVYRFAPFGADVAREMIMSIRAAPLLTGYRGMPALDVDALADLVSRISWLAADHADRIAEIDLNPVFVGPLGKGCVVADGLMILKTAVR